MLRRRVLWSLVTVLSWGGPLRADDVAAEWTTKELMKGLQQRAQELSALVDKTNPKAWTAQGAPQAYESQKRALEGFSGQLMEQTRQLGAHPEKLSVAVQVLFQLQTIESTLFSFIDGVRNYQDAKLGEDLSKLWAANVQNRDRLKQYVVDLSAVHEDENEALRKEAQRCRVELLQRPSDQKPSRPAPNPKNAPAVK